MIGLYRPPSYIGELVYVRNKFKAAQELREEAMEYSSYLPLRRIREKGSGYFAKLIADQVNDAFIVLDYPFLKNIFMLLRTAAVLGITFSWDRRLFAVFAINAVFVASYSTIFNRATRSLFSQGLELIRQILALIVESLELRSLRQEEIFGLVGYHPQHIGIFNDTLENNILMGRPREEHKLERIISELALDHLRGRSLGEGGTFISGGEKQKVELARLFYGEKDVGRDISSSPTFVFSSYPLISRTPCLTTNGPRVKEIRPVRKALES